MNGDIGQCVFRGRSSIYRFLFHCQWFFSFHQPACFPEILIYSILWDHWICSHCRKKPWLANSFVNEWNVSQVFHPWKGQQLSMWQNLSIAWHHISLVGEPKYGRKKSSPTLFDEFLHNFDVARLHSSDHRGQRRQVDAVAGGHVGREASVVQIDPSPAELVGSIHKWGHGTEAPCRQTECVLHIFLLAPRLYATYANRFQWHNKYCTVLELCRKCRAGICLERWQMQWGSRCAVHFVSWSETEEYEHQSLSQTLLVFFWGPQYSSASSVLGSLPCVIQWGGFDPPLSLC